MARQDTQYRSDDPDSEPFDEDKVDHRVAPYNLRRSAPTNLRVENSVPLFLSDRDGEPDPSEYITPLLAKRRSSTSSRILAATCAAAGAAILVAMLSSDATRDILVKAKASVAAVLPTPSAAAQSDPSQLTALAGPSEPSQPSAQDSRALDENVTVAAAEPAREEIKKAYQSALQGQASAADAVAEPTTPADTIHHLDPETIDALLRRADALIASGDIAAARLVLRRAADAGDAHAAMALGGTYDPANLAKLGVHGMVPDVAMAQSWYEKASKFGSAEAPQRLEMLANRRQ
jgi:TPR repeat protein